MHIYLDYDPTPATNAFYKIHPNWFCSGDASLVLCLRQKNTSLKSQKLIGCTFSATEHVSKTSAYTAHANNEFGDPEQPRQILSGSNIKRHNRAVVTKFVVGVCYMFRCVRYMLNYFDISSYVFCKGSVLFSWAAPGLYAAASSARPIC